MHDGHAVYYQRVATSVIGEQQSRIRVGVMNSRQYPKSEDELRRKAVALGNELMVGLFQISHWLVGPGTQELISRHPEDIKLSALN